MADRKTVPTGVSVSHFVSAIEDPQKRADAETLVSLLADVTNEPPAMWGSGIIGFGSAHYRYPSGREGDTFLIGFSPRKQNLVLYLGGLERQERLLSQLGPHTLGRGCLYIKRLRDVHGDVLRGLLEATSKEPRR